MRSSVSYRSPDHIETEVLLTGSLTIGRAPGSEGVVLTPEDPAVSGVALVVEQRNRSVVIRNTSSFAQIDVHHEQGVRFLFPGEELTVASNVEITVPGSVYSHRIYLKVENASPELATSTGTVPLLSEAFQVPDERRAVLVALCAARFFPERYGSALLTASDISEVLAKIGEQVTPKAVNNKLQRLRTDIAERLGVFLDRREDLADWSIKQGHVTRSDVEQLLHR